MKHPAFRSAVLLALALAQPEFAGAVQTPADPVPQWVWLGESAQPDERAFFRKAIELKRAGSARLYASCDDEMTVFINGKLVAKQAGWNPPLFKEVGDYFEPGRNVIAIAGVNNTSAAGLLVRLVFEAGRTEPFAIVTDETWRVSPTAGEGWQTAGFDDSKWAPSTVLGKLGDPPRAAINEAAFAAAANLRAPTATPVERLSVADGFKVELLYSVPKEEQGSWVAMTTDDKGRFIVSDQYGSLYRFPKPGPGQVVAPAAVERIDVDLGHAQGLLHAFGSLYVVVNSNEIKKGLYRVADTDGDDHYDKVELLREFLENAGEHGPHAAILSPDGKSICVISGNQTALPEYDRTRVPPLWQEDQLLPRIYGRGFMKGVLAPRGWIARTDPDGKTWEILATGFRNEYDAAFNADGELFSYDADMEWDLNTPWYRPTRVCHVPSGAEFGWRNGSAKWPVHYPDSLPPAVDIGPGSPTGVCFGYGAKFPAKYQRAFFICDWSYGKLYAVHLEPEGASYKGTFEEFISAQPLPLTDILIHPGDGAMYFAIGGRRVQSGLYRVTYTGTESAEPADLADSRAADSRELRRSLEAFHGVQDERAVEVAWPHLAHSDRFIRYAARTAIEHQPPEAWKERALNERIPVASIEALIALCRSSDPDIVLYDRVHGALDGLDYGALPKPQRLALLRARALSLIRLKPENHPLAASQVTGIENQVGRHFPAESAEENIEISQLLASIGSPQVVEKGVGLLKTAPTQEEQIALAKNIRLATAGWTAALREDYFRWFVRAATYRGGDNFALFMADIKNDAIAGLTAAEKEKLQPIIDAKPATEGPQFTFEPRSFVREWKVSDFDDVLGAGFEGGRDFKNGRNLFGATGCYACHRFDQQGGAIGPDLTSAAGKYSPRDLLEHILDPSKEVSDQYGSIIITKNDGSTVVGRIMNLSGDEVKVNTNLYDPSEQVGVDRKLVADIVNNPLSMMPPGLLNTLQKDDILDLMAYLLSGGNRESPLFK